jgi:broad specificity phosphatase PhoE
MYFVRHGESMHNKHTDMTLNSDLTAWGIMQAHNVGRELSQLDLIEYSGLVSPARRTRQTADIIAEHTGLNFLVCTALRDWAGEVTLDGIGYPSENGNEVEVRCADFWSRIKGQKFVVVSHESPIRIFLQLASELPINLNDRRLKVDNAVKIWGGGRA